MKPKDIIILLRKAVEKKNLKAIRTVYRYAEKIDWEHVPDAIFNEYDELISPANDLLYEAGYSNTH